MKRLLGFWNRFWFGPVSRSTTALVRIALGLYFLLIAITSFPNWLRFYGPDGLAPFNLMTGGPGSWSSLFMLSGTEEWCWLLYFIFLVCSVFLLAGYKTTLAAWALFVLHGSMIRRNIYIVNGQDQVAQLLLLFACFAPLGAAYSVDARRSGDDPDSKSYEAWPLRLMQVSLAIIYLSCGPTKYETWKDGLAIYYSGLSPEWARYPNAAFLRNELISRLMTFATIALETSFAFLVWIPKCRLWVIVTTAGFHLGLMALLSPAVFHFNLIMLVGLLSFLKAEEAEWILKCGARSFFGRPRSTRPGTDLNLLCDPYSGQNGTRSEPGMAFLSARIAFIARSN